jgi:hypothetical protein
MLFHGVIPPTSHSTIFGMIFYPFHAKNRTAFILRGHPFLDNFLPLGMFSALVKIFNAIPSSLFSAALNSAR